MWLPKDERRMLEAYVSLIRGIDREKWFHEGDLIPVLSEGIRSTNEPVPEYGEGPGYADKPIAGTTPAEYMRAYLRNLGRVELANNLLQARSLITVKNHQTQTNVVGIALTLSGFDLGRRYGAGFWHYSALWFEAHRHHWIWLIVGFVGGIIGGVLGNWLSS